MSRPAATRTHRARLPPEGFPGHVRGWCVKAGEGTMKQGYRDVGYLFAPHIRRFKPPAIPSYAWIRRLRSLAEPVEARNQLGVEQWLQAQYPRLMELIPVGLHHEFAAGVIERVTEQIGGEGN